MTVRPASRRLLVGGTSAALLLGAVGAVPLLAVASAACAPTYTDPAGDAVTVQDGVAIPGVIDLGNDPDLDILDVTHTVDAGAFSSVVHVKQLQDFGPVVSYVDEFVTHFTVSGKAVDLAARRTHSMFTFFDGAPGFPPQTELDKGTLTVAGTATTVPVKVVVDLKASTVTAQVAVPAMETALGGSLAGKAFSAMTAESNQILSATTNGSPLPYESSPGLRVPMDAASAPATAGYVFGASCSGASSTPAATGSPAPGSSPSPTPSATPSPSGTTLFDQPRKGCAQYTDPAGDADPTPTGQDNEPALDVTQVNLKSPADGSLQTYVKVANLSGGLNWPEESGVYTTAMTITGKTVAVTFDETGAVSSTTVAGAATTDLVPMVKADTKSSEFVVTLPRAGLEKALKTSITPGTPVTGTSVATKVASPPSDFDADSAAGTTAAQKTYAYGDNTCFLPPAGVISLDADRKGQYGDKTELFATLNDSDGSPVPGVTLTGQLTGGKAVAAVTDADGIADLRLPITTAAGAKTLTVSFAGNSDVGATKATAPFTVVAEKAVLKAVGTRGGAQATLLDDDRHPIVGQSVLFTVGSKRTVVKTNAKGVALLGRIAKGTTVKVGYPGLKGRYLATPTYSVKAL